MNREYHFIRELREQPDALRRSLAHTDAALRQHAHRYAGRAERVILAGCGDPYMLSVGAVYAFEQWAKVPAEAIEAAEFSMYRHGTANDRALLIAITSSGKTVKVLDCARLASQAGARVVALTNLVPSPITEVTDTVLQTQAGWSDAFPTKQTTSALGILYALALHWAEAGGAMDANAASELRSALFNDVPAAMEKALAQEEAIREVALSCLDAPIYTFIGSGPNLATAMLGAAKMKETSQSRAEASNAEEYGHLHALPLVPNDINILVTASGEIDERNRLLAGWITENEGRLVVVGPEAEATSWMKLGVRYISVPDHHEMFGPLISLLPLQMFAYYVSVGKGRNPDRPPERGKGGDLQRLIYTSALEGWEDR